MKNIYIASNSVEADSVVNKLSQNGINASCRQKENFRTGKQLKKRHILHLMKILNQMILILIYRDM